MEKIAFPKGFFTQPRPHITTEKSMEGTIPFQWSETVLSGKSKVKIVSNKNS